MERIVANAYVTSYRQLPVTSHHHRSTTTTSSELRRFLLIATTMMTLLSSPVQAAAILPPHMLLKSDSSNVVDGARSTSGGGSHRQSKTGAFGSSSMRPSPSDNLPVLPLPPFNSKDSLPTKADRDPRVLRAMVGSDFDASFMSVKRPSDSYRHPNGTYVYDHAVIKAMATSIRLGGFKVPGQRTKLFQIKSKKKRRLLQNYLAAFTYCPVHYKWIDLGQRFWPRWIRQGDCSPAGNEGKGVRSCSFPAGMSCKPQKSTSKTILWWHCQSRGQCQWIPIKYPVITTCKCSC